MKLAQIIGIAVDHKQFPSVRSSRASKSNCQILSTHSEHTRKGGRSATSSLALVGCKEAKAKGWAIEAVDQDLDQVCWRINSESYDAPFCAYRRRTRLTSDSYMFYKAQYQRKDHLLATTTTPICINASPKQRLTSKELKRGSLSPCEWHTNQIWELGINGTLVNSYSGLCATVQKVAGNAVPRGIRSWLATGRRAGEVYLAFFNLDQGKTVISAKLSNLAKALPRVRFGASCRCTEVWSKRDCFIRRGAVSMGVEAHGAALLILNCPS